MQYTHMYCVHIVGGVGIMDLSRGVESEGREMETEDCKQSKNKLPNRYLK